MIDGKRVLAWIPARGGSKGIKDKNIRDLNGKPLIAYTIEAAAASSYVDKIMVSTDSRRIADIAEAYGAWVPSLRPAELAADTSKTLDAVLYTIELMRSMYQEFQVFCLLQPTSPLRDSRDIDCALEAYVRCGCNPVVSVSPVEDQPLLIRSIADDGTLQPLLHQSSTCRRQDMKPYYVVNGSIYINPVSELGHTTSFNDNAYPYLMDREHGIDIDTLADFDMAADILKKRNLRAEEN